jgi:Tol biopolymer transport system component
VSPALAATVKRALEKVPRDRFVSTGEFSHALTVALEAPVTARRSWRWPRFVALAALPVLGVAATAGLWWLATRDPLPTPSPGRRVTTLGDVLGAALSPDGRQLAFRRSPQFDAVWVQSVDSGSPRRLLENMPGAMSWLDDSTIVVLDRNNRSRPRLIRLAAGSPESPVWANDSGGRWFFAGGGSVLYHLSIASDSTTLVLRRATPRGLDDSLVVLRDSGERNLWVAATPASRRLALATRMVDSTVRLSVVQPGRGRTIVRSIPSGDSTNVRVFRTAPVMAGDARHLYFSQRDEEEGPEPLRLLRFDLRHAERPFGVVSPPAKGSSPWGLTVGGRVAWIVTERLMRTWRFAVPGDSGPPPRLIDQSSGTAVIALSPDGQVFARVEPLDGEPGRDLFLQNVSGTSRKRLTTLRRLPLVPTWSPDGNRIAFRVHSSGETPRWMVVDVRDGAVMELGTAPISSRTTHIPGGWPPAWSPDGQAVFVVDVDTTVQRRVRRFALVPGDTGTVISQWWSGPGRGSPEGIVVRPDGGALAVGGRSSLVIVPLDGSPEHEIARRGDGELLIPLQWRTNGQIVFVTRDTVAGSAIFRGLRHAWVVAASGGAVRSLGTLPADCVPGFSVLAGGDISCFEFDQTSDVWVMDGLTR